MSAASAFDDDPGPVHALDCDVMARTVGPCTCGADDTRLVWPLLVAGPGTVAARLDTLLPLPCEEAS